MANGTPADSILGQPNMTSADVNTGGISGQSMNQPSGVYSDGTRVFTADTANNRIVVAPLP